MQAFLQGTLTQRWSILYKAVPIDQAGGSCQAPGLGQAQDGLVYCLGHAEIIRAYTDLPVFGHRSLRFRFMSRQIILFILVGTLAAFTHWGIVIALVQTLSLSPLLANLFGWLTAFLVSFGGHYWLTFRSQNARFLPALSRFFLVSAAGFAVNEASYAFLLNHSGLRYDLLLGLILIGLAVLTFLAGRLWAFRRT
jgi:putative flippase GtrA